MKTPATIAETQSDLLSGGTTVVQIVQTFLSNITKIASLNVYINVWKEEALQRAADLDQKILNKSSKLGSLFGCVISIKDVICHKGHPLSAGSKILQGFVSQYNSSAVEYLLAEDAIIIGVTNCDEFAMGSTNEHSFYGPTLNGKDSNFVPGGSSGGAAVAVQMRTCHIALGSDTGGSVRQPASFCGISGFKPSYGAVSRNGLIAYGSSFDQIGILAHFPEDIAKVFEVIAKKDHRDGTTIDLNQYHEASALSAQKPLTIAYITEMLDHPGLSQDIKVAFEARLSHYVDQGFVIKPFSFELLDYLVPTYYVLTTAEASSNLSRYDGIRYGYRAESMNDIEELMIRTRSEGFGKEVKRRIMMGTFVLSVGYFEAYFVKAQSIRRLICDRIDELLMECDFLAMPTTTSHAWKLGEGIKDPVEMYLSDIYTVLANLSGIPAISTPLGKNIETNMPFGIQFASKRFDDKKLLKFVDKYLI